MTRCETKAAGMAVLLAAAAGGSWTASAQQLEMGVDNQPRYALEVFGPGSGDLDYSEGNEPKVTLKVTEAKIESGQKAEITFTLDGAKFGQRVRTSNLGVATSTKNTIDREVVSDGAKGDSEVTFKVEAGPEGLAVGDVIEFTLPPVSDATARLANAYSDTGVRVFVEVDPVSSNSGGGSFPVYEFDALDDAKTANMSEARVILPSQAGSQEGYKSHWAVTLNVDDGDTGNVNVEKRTELINSDTRKPVSKLKLASVSVRVDSTLWQSDGSPFAIEGKNADGAGYLKIEVSGNLRDEDSLFYNLDGDAQSDTGEDLTKRDSMASRLFKLDSVPEVGGRDVYLVPGGQVLRPGPITTTASIIYDSGTSRNPAAKTKNVALQYDGSPDAVDAYAIAPTTSGDISNVRVKCEASAPCQVYFACDGQDGSDIFGKVPDAIGARSTRTFRQMDIQNVVGDAWTGRLSCSVISTNNRPVSVQVLTRSGGVLVNNTYVEDGSRKVKRAAAEAAAKAVAESLKR